MPWIWIVFNWMVTELFYKASFYRVYRRFFFFLVWFWSDFEAGSIYQPFSISKNLRDLVCNTAKTLKFLGDDIILRVYTAVKRMSSSRQMPVFMTPVQVQNPVFLCLSFEPRHWMWPQLSCQDSVIALCCDVFGVEQLELCFHVSHCISFLLPLFLQ